MKKSDCQIQFLKRLFHNTYYYIPMSKFPFSCVSLVESVSRESDEIRLSPSHQRERETTRYSPVNNEKITCAIM